MIIGTIVRMFSYLVAGLFHFLPAIPTAWTAGLSTTIAAFVAWLGPFISPWNYYVPLHLWFTLFLLYLGMEFSMSVWSGILFVLALIRGSDHG